MTSISVAMATYNGATYIAEQLQSIASQTMGPTELVVTDDASTDNTTDIVERFAATASFPVRLYRNSERLGYRANFMRSVSLCDSQVIAFCDQDDVWQTTKLEQCLTAFDRKDVLLCFHEAILIDKDGKPGDLAKIYRLPPENPPLSIFPMKNAFGFTILFRRCLTDFSDLWDYSIDNIEPQNRMAHDQWFFFLASVFGTIVFVDQPLASYRQHDNNTYGMQLSDKGAVAQFLRHLLTSSSEYRTFSVATKRRAEILAKISSRLQSAMAIQARTAADYYEQLSERYSLRSAVYNTSGVFGRLGAWRKLLMTRGYTSKGLGAFGRRAAVRDLRNLLVPRSLVHLIVPKERGDVSSATNDPRLPSTTAL